MKKLPKIVLCFIFSLFLFLSFPQPIRAENKAGINIGDHFGDFDQAAGIVGDGGWIVVMACPGDGDTLATMITKYPKINLVIRGHYPGQEPTLSSAKQWAATLATLPTDKKIFFMPWNEPNQYGSDDFTTAENLNRYITDLKNVLAPIRQRVFLLSPMMNVSHPRYDDYLNVLLGINSSFFTSFDGIAFSLYDTCDRCSDPHGNPLLSPQLLGQLRASGKPIFGVESGTMGQNPYFATQPPGKNSPLYNFVNSMLQGPAEIRMFAIPAYDLAGEVGHTWNLFEMSSITNLLASAPDGQTFPGVSPTSASLAKCPGKNYSFYVSSPAECGQCGSMVSYCKPIKEAQTFGEEISRQSIYIPEEATYRRTDGACLAATFKGKIEISDFKIPFARDLNKYFLGSLVDNPKDRLGLATQEFLKAAGVFNKLSPEKIQNNLKLEFLNEISRPGYNGRYVGFRIEAKDPAWIAQKFNEWHPLVDQGRELNEEQKKFFALIWPQVPLIANEESRGHVVFYASGIEEVKNIVDTSVPEVYRLNKVTTLLQEMLTPPSPTPTVAVQGINTQGGAVLADQVCPVTFTVPKQENQKEGKTGLGDNICTKPEIQPAGRQFEGKREWENDAPQEGCEMMGMSNCSSALDLGNCCTKDGNPGVCNYYSGYGVGFYCDTTCPAGCKQNSSGPGCCVPANPLKTKQFTDTNLNSINKVPFLDQIVKNTIEAPNGFFNLFTTYLVESGQIKTKPPELEEAFREVVGESPAKLKIEIDQITKTPDYQEFKIAGSSTHAIIENPLTLLFYKLGTLINVKDFISKKLLIPAVYESE